MNQNPKERPIIGRMMPTLLRAGQMYLLTSAKEGSASDDVEERWLVGKD